MSQITPPAIRKATRKAATGASTRAMRDTSARGASSSRMRALAGDAHHLEPDLVARPRGRRPRRPELAAADHRDAVGDLEQLVEILADDEDAGALDRKIDQRLPDEPRRAGIDPPSRLIDDEDGRAADDLAADDEFLQVAARELAGLRIAPRPAHVEARDDPLRQAPRRSKSDDAAAGDLARRVMGEDRVLAQAVRRHRGMAEPLLGHEGGAEAPAGVDAVPPAGAAADRDACRRRGEPLAGDRREQLALAVAGDASDAEDFALPYRQADLLQGPIVRISGRQRQAAHRERLLAGSRRPTGLHLADLGADHQGRDGAGARLARVERRDDPAVAQHGRGPAQAAHLLELVRDVEDRAAFAGKPLERLEEPLGLLRGQHRGRLVEDDELRILEQAADDLDPLPLAGRKGPDRPIGLQPEPVAAADLVEPPAHRLERGGAGERDGDVLGDGELVEEREVLEHHVDAEAARLDRRADAHRPALPGDLARTRLDHAVEDLDEGRLAGAVLAEERVDLAAPDREIDAVVGKKPAVALGDAAERDEGSPAPVRSRGHRITGPSTSGDASSSSRRAASSSASSSRHPGIMFPRIQGCMMVAPVVSRPSSARWTASASLSLRREGIGIFTAPRPTMSKRSLAISSRVSRFAM